MGYSPRVEEALRVAFRLHAHQHRKSEPGLPYATHLAHVAMIVQQYGFPEDVVIAALLHDTIEDTSYTREKLLRDFGAKVCGIVLEVTEDKSLRWDERKARYIAHMRTASFEARAVCCADKLHNLSTLLEAMRRKGMLLWRAFSRGPERTLRFYEDVYEALRTGWDHPMLREYAAVLDEARRQWSKE